jgi:hypothetical protein
MASFEGVLANIPGYGGYLAKETYNRNQTAGDIQQMTGIQGLMAQMQQQQMAQGIRGVLSDTAIPDDQKIQKLAQLGEPGMKVAGVLMQVQKQTADMAEQKRLRELRPALMAKYTTPEQPAVVGNVTPTGGMSGFQSGIAEDDGAQGVTPARPAGLDTRGFLREAATQGLIPTEAYFNHEAQLEDKKIQRADARAKAIEDRQARLDGITMQLASKEMEGDANRALRESLQAQSNALRTDLAAMRQDGAGKPPVGYRFKADGTLEAIPGGPASRKNTQLPPSALKEQNAELEDIGISASIQADLAEARKLIADKKLDLGLASNAISAARNYTGQSNEQSRNFASLKATVEKMRNDSLRLNKGVQTEGDAVRAFNELLANLNDPEVVKQRFAEIEKINARAVNLRKMKIDTIRQNFGVEPLDTAAFENQRPAIGDGARAPDAPARQDAPKAAIDFYKMNKNKPGIKEQFQAKYGYTPD